MAEMRRTTWLAFMRALAVSSPLIVFLLAYRWAMTNRYVTYTLPALGEFPKAALADLTLLLLALALWLAMRPNPWTRRLYYVVMAPLGFVALLFRATDYYYYASTHVRLNIYVLYGNLNMLEEGTGVVMHAPAFFALSVAVLAHFVAAAFSPRYRGLFERAGERAARQPRALVIPVSAVVVVLLAMNAHAIVVSHKRYSTLKSLSGEYELLDALPAFLQEETQQSSHPAPRPARLYLPATPVLPTGAARAARKPDIFIITVESFNALYTLPPAELHPALTEAVMPFFNSLASEGTLFPHAYTSSAYTFNGITSVLCSQFTMSESVWGHGCLPETLVHQGYDVHSLISIKQLRPYRYDNFRAMGFDRARVLDAVRMREGKQNVYFNFMTDKELLDYAAGIADSSARAPGRKPLFVHASTNQMHVPGYFQVTTCKPYPFPASLTVDRTTRNMLDSARCTDRDIAAFFARLRQDGLYDDALIVVTADHAFNLSFWSHTESELARIPLFIKLPKSGATFARMDTAQLVAQVDIAPTLLDYLGVAPERPMYGHSLLAPATAPASMPGISSSRLLALDNVRGQQFHVHGQPDLRDEAARSELDALFDTVLYFDQHPNEFEREVRTAPASSRWAPPSLTAAAGTTPARGH